MSFDASKYTQSKWLHGADIPMGQSMTLTIREALEHTFDDGSTRPVIRFLEVEQTLALNKTQVSTLIALFGPNAAAWIGQRVDLTSQPSGFNGKPTIAIRAAAPVMPTFNGQQMGQPPAPAPQPGPAMSVDPLWERQQPPAPQNPGGVSFR